MDSELYNKKHMDQIIDILSIPLHGFMATFFLGSLPDPLIPFNSIAWIHSNRRGGEREGGGRLSFNSIAWIREPTVASVDSLALELLSIPLHGFSR